MKRVSLIVLALLLAIPTLAFADRNDISISVQGTATVTAAPDIVRITSNASVTAETVAKAQERINAIVEDVTKKLLALGVAEDDIVTQNYSYYPNYDYSDPNGGGRLVGYQASHTLLITCRNAEMLDSAVGIVTDAGMSEIYNIGFDLSNRSALYRQALALAVQAAGEKAEALAQASGTTIDHLETLTENTSYYDDVTPSMGGAMYSLSKDAIGTGIRAGSVSVQASVTAVYETK